MPRFHVLGSGGWVPTLARQTCCHLVETRRSLIFLDCGTGISRLHDPMFRAILQRHRRAIVLLSHWHHDHIEGLQALPLFLSHMSVTVAGPGRDICGESAAAVLTRFGSAPLLSEPLPHWGERFAGGFSIVDLKPGKNSVDGERVDVIAQPHTHPSAGMRVRDVTYITDTVERPESVALAAGSALLVHDAWLDREDAVAGGPETLAHCSAEGAARVAASAKVSALVLTHLNPRYDSVRLERMFLEAAATFPATHLGTDMSSLQFGAQEEETIAPGAATVGSDGDL